MRPKQRVRLPTDSAPVRVRRAYFDCRFGQLHVRTAFPTSGGFDEKTTLLCFHASPLSSRMFRAFLPEIATDRSVYAPDAPGCGESDAPADKPTIGDLAAAMSDFVESMRFRQIDVLGYRTGSLIAAELAILLPEQIRRVVLVSVPALSNEERESFRGRAQPSAASENGSHLQREWEQTLKLRSPGMTLEMCDEALAERLYNGPNAWWGAHAVHQYAATERLPLVRQPTLVIRPNDELWQASARARQLVRGTRMVDLPDQGFGVFSVAPAIVARQVRDFLS